MVSKNCTKCDRKFLGDAAIWCEECLKEYYYKCSQCSKDLPLPVLKNNTCYLECGSTVLWFCSESCQRNWSYDDVMKNTRKNLTGGNVTQCYRPDCNEDVYRESAYLHKGRLFCGDTCQQQHDAEQVEEKRADMIKPDYYQPDSIYEPFKIIRHYGLNFFEGNVLKYLLRAGKKSSATRLKDLQKASTYLASEIDIEKQNEEETDNTHS